MGHVRQLLKVSKKSTDRKPTASRIITLWIIPSELLLHIARFLPPPSLLAWALTCRFFKNVLAPDFPVVLTLDLRLADGSDKPTHATSLPTKDVISQTTHVKVLGNLENLIINESSLGYLLAHLPRMHAMKLHCLDGARAESFKMLVTPQSTKTVELEMEWPAYMPLPLEEVSMAYPILIFSNINSFYHSDSETTTSALLIDSVGSFQSFGIGFGTSFEPTFCHAIVITTLIAAD